jgi:hypothetical protein
VEEVVHHLLDQLWKLVDGVVSDSRAVEVSPLEEGNHVKLYCLFQVVVKHTVHDVMRDLTNFFD